MTQAMVGNQTNPRLLLSGASGDSVNAMPYGQPLANAAIPLAATTTYTLPVNAYSTLEVDVRVSNVTGASASLTLVIARQDAQGVSRNIFSAAVAIGSGNATGQASMATPGTQSSVVITMTSGSLAAGQMIMLDSGNSAEPVILSTVTGTGPFTCGLTTKLPHATSGNIAVVGDTSLVLGRGAISASDAFHLPGDFGNNVTVTLVQTNVTGISGTVSAQGRP